MKHINQILLTISHAESLRNSTSLHCVCSAPHGVFNVLKCRTVQKTKSLSFYTKTA